MSSPVLIVSTRPQLYHSLCIDQRVKRAVHVLPEKYQFCSIGAIASYNYNNNNNSSQFFGSCTAQVHCGLCTDFDVFVVDGGEDNQLKHQQQSNIAVVQPLPRWRVVNKSIMIAGSMLSNTCSSSTESIHSSSTVATERSIASRIESYRDNFGATIDLLYDNEDESDSGLHDLIR